MADSPVPASDRVRPLRRVRQVREFTSEPVHADELRAITEVARWSGSSRNSQPWRFIVVTNADTITRIAAAGLPQTRALPTAQAAIAIAVPDEADATISRAYDEGRAAERMLIAASLLGPARAAARPPRRAPARPTTVRTTRRPTQRRPASVSRRSARTARPRWPRRPSHLASGRCLCRQLLLGVMSSGHCMAEPRPTAPINNQRLSFDAPSTS